MTREIHFVFRALTYTVIILLALAALYAILSSKPHPTEVQSESRRFMGLPLSPDCDSLQHKDWAECMGVGYTETIVDRFLWDHKHDD